MNLVVIPQSIFFNDLSDPSLSEFPSPLVADRLSLIEPEFDQVTLISGWQYGESTTRYPNGNVHHSVRTSDNRIQSFIKYTISAANILYSLRNENIVILNFNSSFIGVILASLARILGIDFVTYFLGMPEQFGGSRRNVMGYRFLLQLSTRSICSTPVFQDRLREIADVPINIVPHGIDPMFEPDPLVERDDNLILYVGRFDPEKRLPLLLEAFADVADTHPDARLTMVGARSDQQHRAIMTQATDLDIADRVETVDRVPREEIPTWMNRARVFVLPSHDEAFGMVLLEAMACGTPTIGMESGSVPWVVDDDRFVCDSPDDLAATIERVLVDDAFFENAQAHALNRAADFPYDEWGQRIYESIVGTADNSSN